MVARGRETVVVITVSPAARWFGAQRVARVGQPGRSVLFFAKRRSELERARARWSERRRNVACGGGRRRRRADACACSEFLRRQPDGSGDQLPAVAKAGRQYVSKPLRRRLPALRYRQRLVESGYIETAEGSVSRRVEEWQLSQTRTPAWCRSHRATRH